ncbi:uncharacterized protein KQ657_000897 [Scheffersomyces spartinae]|uniref:Uncharacterized protein n=1 Tax=Scheffersomyces spartinae TaxID=45513 RepID=A0A9P7V8B4_9ASCO|nr:uncharacterized protein KQ657_000897 [Scheffersomyces spartinae]KAG7193143.1 hypothetical protein KQ657_000897 [Scheffersomyces spartinae]
MRHNTDKKDHTLDLDNRVVYRKGSEPDLENENGNRAAINPMLYRQPPPPPPPQQNGIPIPILVVDPYYGNENEGYFRQQPIRRSSRSPVMVVTDSYPTPTNNNKFPAAFLPRKAEKMSFEEKVLKWLCKIPMDFDVPTPYVDCYPPTVSSSSSYEVNGGVNEVIDYGDTDLVLERQSHVITKLSKKLYQAERAVAGDQVQQHNASTPPPPPHDNNNIEPQRLNGPLNSWINYQLKYVLNPRVRVPSEDTGAQAQQPYTKGYVGEQEKLYPELIKLLDDCH